MRKLILATAAVGLAFTSAPALADGHEEAKPEEANVDWYNINLIKWKSGKGDRAHEIIDLFEKVDAAIGDDGPIDFHMRTGEWHSIVAFKMNHGPAEIGWRNSPDQAKWWAEFVSQSGGEEQANALWAEFQSCIDEQQRHIGHIDRD